MKVSTAICVFSALMAGCASPTAPTTPTTGTMTASIGDTRISNALTWTPVNAPCNEASVEFIGWAAIVTNESNCENSYTLIIWDYRNEADQLPMAHYTTRLRPGERAWLSVGFSEDCGRLYQRDVYMNLPVIGPGHRYTMSDVMNAVYWTPGTLLDGCGRVPAATPPPGPLDPSGNPPVNPSGSPCELRAFAQIDEMQVAGGVASIRLRLRPGYDNVVVYMLAYGSTTRFPVVGGRVSPTFPQTLVSETRFVIRAGAAQTISIPVPRHVVAYQIDAGCVPGPPILHNRQTYPPAAFLEAAVGNNQ